MRLFRLFRISVIKTIAVALCVDLCDLMEAIDNREILCSAKENRSARVDAGVGWGDRKTVVFGLAHSYGNKVADLLIKGLYY